MKSALIALLFLTICGGSRDAAAEAYWPVRAGKLTSSVGWRFDPFGSRTWKYHRGYDIAVPPGTVVMATAPGKVYFAGRYKGYGHLVVVEHAAGIYTLFGHNSRLLVKYGQEVVAGTPIALSGNSGRSTGPHVHYEIRQVAQNSLPPQQVARNSAAETDSGFGDGLSREGGGWVAE